MLTMSEINCIKFLRNEKSYSINCMCQVFLDIALSILFSALTFCTLTFSYRAFAWLPEFFRHVLRT